MSLINLIDDLGEVPNASFVPSEKAEMDEFAELMRDLREVMALSRTEENRCIFRTLIYLLQISHETRIHVREIHVRVEDMVSNTKDLRQRTSEVLATVEKESCQNVPQSAIKNEVRRMIEEYGTLFPDSKQINDVCARLCVDTPTLKSISKMAGLVKKRLVKERHEISTKVRSLDHLPLEDLAKNVFSSSVEFSMDHQGVLLIAILREFFRQDEEDQTRLMKESNTTSPPQYAEFMKNKLKDDGEMKRKVFDLACEMSVGKRQRRE